MQPTDGRDATGGPSRKHSLFERALGASYADLPSALRAFHDATGAAATWRGEADVEPSAGGLAVLVARLFGFPDAGRRIPLTVTVRRRGEDSGPAEVWEREFGDRRMTSTLRYRSGSLTETFGPFTFALNVRANAAGLDMAVRGWRLGRVPLPGALAPRSAAREHEDSEGRFRFDVDIRMPVLGRLVRYHGWLAPGVRPTRGTTRQAPPGVNQSATNEAGSAL